MVSSKMNSYIWVKEGYRLYFLLSHPPITSHPHTKFLKTSLNNPNPM